MVRSFQNMRCFFLFCCPKVLYTISIAYFLRKEQGYYGKNQKSTGNDDLP